MIIYLTTNLINNKKYIGRDSRNIKSYYGGGNAIILAIKKYGKENFKKEIIEECNDFEHLKEREEYWLNYYNASKDPMFYNMINTSAGWEKGRTHSEKTRKLISLNGRGKTGKTGAPKSPVIQYKILIKKEYIKSFISIKQAAEQNNMTCSDITACCRGKQLTVNGYNFEYLDPTLKQHRPKAVIMNKIIKEYIEINNFISIIDASNKTNTNKNEISKVCIGKALSAGGYFWKYK